MTFSPITSWQIEAGKVETVMDFVFLGSKITVDSDCSHEIKRCLLLGRKAMTNLDSVLKSRDITLLTKVCLVKAMVSPVVLYGCESWTIKKDKHWRINWCIQIVLLEKTLESPLDCKEINQSMEKAMATHSSTLAWKIPWTEEPGRLQSMGLLRVRHDWATSLSLFTFTHWRGKWQPTPVFLPIESQGRGSLGGLPSLGSHRIGHDWSDLVYISL